MCFTSVCFVLSVLSPPVFAEASWDVRGHRASLGTSGWVVSAKDLNVHLGQLLASEFVVIGPQGVLIRGETLACTPTACSMASPVLYRKESAVRARQGELELSTGRVVLKGLGNRTFEER